MNFGAIIPRPNIMASRPVKISTHGNVYRIPIVHTDAEGNTLHKYEVWTTKEAVQKHFQGMIDLPGNPYIKKFARQMYENRMRATNGRLEEKGMFVTSDQITHGNPAMWPHTIMHPEVKV